MPRKLPQHTRTTFEPPRVRVSVNLEEDSRLARAEQALTAEQSEADRATRALIEGEQAKLAPAIETARIALDRLRKFEKETGEDLKLLRSLRFEGARSRYPDPEGKFEASRVRTESAVRDFFGLLSSTRDVLVLVAPRAERLSPADLLAGRMSVETPGIAAYTDLPYAVTARIQLDAERSARTVAGLPKRLDEVKRTVAVFVADLERKKGEAVRSTATIRDPEEIARAADMNPHAGPQTSYGNFSPYESDRK